MPQSGLLRRVQKFLTKTVNPGKPETKEVAKTGYVTLWGSRLFSNETADEHLRRYGLGWYKKLANEAQTAAALDILYSAVGSCWNSASGYVPTQEEWNKVLQEIQHLPITYQAKILYASFDIHAAQVVPPKDPTPMELKCTDFCRWSIDNFLGRNRHQDSDLNGRNFGQVIEQTLTAIEDGKSVQEIDWKQIDDGPWAGKWGINDIWHRYPSFFSFDDNGKLWMKRYVSESNPTIKLPLNKLIVCSHNFRYENFEGQSALGPLSNPYDFGRNFKSMEAISAERFGMPTAVGYLDEESNKTADEMLTFMERLQRGASLVLIKNDEKLLEEIRFIETSRRAGSDMFEIPIQRNQRLVSKNLLGSALALEEGENGSYSLAKATAAPNFRRKIQRLVKLINWIHTTQTLSWMTFFNFPAGTRSPRLNIKLPSSEQIFQQDNQSDNSDASQPEEQK